MPSSLKSQYDAQGFVVVPALVPAGLKPDLERASQVVIARTRAGAWPHRRVVGKQFPPYGDRDPDSWGVQHLMHPDLGQPAFARYYASDEVRGAVRTLLACAEENLQMELFNLLINPTGHAFALCWHRDDVKASATADEEREALAVWHHGIQWNTALHEDLSLFVVPGSHIHPRTPEQRAQSCTTEAPGDPLAMPGAIRVTLHPGDTVFYNSNILHCAAYSPEAPRATLHASMGDTRGGAARARNVLQHGLGWMKEDRFKATLDEVGREMLGRLIRMQEGLGDVGYSLEG
ncbi:hypothetical protein OF83DRAFT_1066816 [Amylostereum chailletii]|nr:hypothetical protein OF83DRAFT_1066816 [Amylostereum chailletii]